MNCPACIGRVVTVQNCLANKSPQLLEEWHPTKNGKLTPYDVTLRSNKKVWWKCPCCNHEWQSSPLNRTQRGKITKCFKCNSLWSQNPELVKEWNPTKNGKLTPEKISYKSGKDVWWRCCSCKNEWLASVRDRCIGEKKCPACNCLMNQNHDLAKEWHPTKNSKLTPYDVSCGSQKKVWWSCLKCQYEWEATVYDRNRGSKSCFRCRSFGSLSEDLTKEWHPTKNGKLTPYDVSWGSIQNIWWKCGKCAHEWMARPQSRNDGNGCPRCKRFVLKDGTVCDSLTDAYYYLYLKEKKVAFLYNDKYGDLGAYGRCRYDFYLPQRNKYIEITSFNKSVKWWVPYLRNIVMKKRHVLNVLGGEFEFVQINLNKSKIKYVRQHLKKD